MSRLFCKKHTKVGARPGTLAISDEAQDPRLYLFNFGGAERTGVTVQESAIDDAEQLRIAHEDDSITWIDLQGFGDQSLLKQIGKIFDLHPLMLEDMVNVPQRPKTESYGDHLLMIVRMVNLDGPNHIEMEQVSVVLGPTYVITFQERHGDVLDPVRKRIRSGKGPLSKNGADFLAYTLIDTIVDAYYPVLEVVGDHLESLEDEVITQPTPELLGQLNRLKNRLVNLRRGIWPQRESLNSIVRGDHACITEEVRLHFRDTYDHAVQTSEVTEMYREMVTGLMNTYLSAIANRTNEVMRVLTIVATIFIPLTFIAGIYGMNFEYMPELHYKMAYPVIWLAMIVVGGGMLGFFWKKGWIGRGPSQSSEATDC